MPEMREVDAAWAEEAHWTHLVAVRSRRMRAVEEWASYWPGVVHPMMARGSEEGAKNRDMFKLRFEEIAPPDFR